MAFVIVNAAFKNGHGNILPSPQMQSAAVSLHRGSWEIRYEAIRNFRLRLQSLHNYIQAGTKRDGNARHDAMRANVCGGLFCLVVAMRRTISLL